MAEVDVREDESANYQYEQQLLTDDGLVLWILISNIFNFQYENLRNVCS